MSNAARRLKELREFAGVSIRKIAEAAAVSPATYHRYEQRFAGDTFPPELLEKLQAGFRVLGVPADRIAHLTGADDGPRSEPQDDVVRAFPSAGLTPAEREEVRTLLLLWRNDGNYLALMDLENRLAPLKRRVMRLVRPYASPTFDDRLFERDAAVSLLEAFRTAEVSNDRPIEQVIEERMLRNLLELEEAGLKSLKRWVGQLLRNISEFERNPPPHMTGRPLVAYAIRTERDECRIDIRAPWRWFKRPESLERALSVYAIRAPAELGARLHYPGELMLVDAGFRHPGRLIGREALLSWRPGLGNIQSACATILEAEVKKGGQVRAQFKSGERSFKREEVVVHRILRTEDLISE
jgi:transcriptional regulator with XRE-family HTH domain